MESPEEQQFCLRWNNFQANFTSQFESLRDAEDFTDVTIACDGQRIQAHKVVLSACSPYFKELFKNNPCSHPIIFMRDVEARHVMALMEFMYAGEVNVAQAHLTVFLKTAESLKIRGLTDTNSQLKAQPEKVLTKPSENSFENNVTNDKKLPNTNNNDYVTNNQEFCNDIVNKPENLLSHISDGQLEAELLEKRLNDVEEVEMDLEIAKAIEPKLELPDYSMNEEEQASRKTFFGDNSQAVYTGPMDMITQSNSTEYNRDGSNDPNYGTDSRKLHSLDPRPCEECGRVYSNLSNLRQHMKLIHYPTFVRCPVCPKTFKTDLYLRRHMITTHDSSSISCNNSSFNCTNNKLVSPHGNRSTLGFHNRGVPPHNDCFTNNRNIGLIGSDIAITKVRPNYPKT